MSATTFSDRSRVTLALTIALVVSAGGLVARAYVMRDEVLATARQEQQQSLQDYVTWKDFLSFQRDEAAKRDAQYYSLMNAIAQLRNRR